MDREQLNTFCRPLPGAEVSDPYRTSGKGTGRGGTADEGTGGETQTGQRHDVWKVGGKVFASIGSLGTGVSVKTPDIETATLLIEMGRAVRAPYFHRSWVFIPWDQVPDDEFQDRIITSYGLIRDKLPKKVQSALQNPD